MSVQINDHPFYQMPESITEKTILEKLTEICGFDTTIGVVDYFPDSPIIKKGKPTLLYVGFFILLIM